MVPKYRIVYNGSPEKLQEEINKLTEAGYKAINITGMGISPPGASWLVALMEYVAK